MSSNIILLKTSIFTRINKMSFRNTYKFLLSSYILVLIETMRQKVFQRNTFISVKVDICLPKLFLFLTFIFHINFYFNYQRFLSQCCFVVIFFISSPALHIKIQNGTNPPPLPRWLSELKLKCCAQAANSRRTPLSIFSNIYSSR